MKRRYNPQKVMKIIGLKIRQMREERSWTLEHCEELGWPDWTHLQKIESGRNITVRTLVNIANMLGVHPSELLKDI